MKWLYVSLLALFASEASAQDTACAVAAFDAHRPALANAATEDQQFDATIAAMSEIAVCVEWRLPDECWNESRDMLNPVCVADLHSDLSGRIAAIPDVDLPEHLASVTQSLGSVRAFDCSDTVAAQSQLTDFEDVIGMDAATMALLCELAFMSRGYEYLTFWDLLRQDRTIGWVN